MNYCQKCQQPCQESVCPNCGNNELQTISEKDFCLLAELNSIYAYMLKDMLNEQSIPAIIIDGFSVATALFALRQSNTKVIVPINMYDQAKEILDTFFTKSMENLRTEILQNADKFFFYNKRTEKKFIKRLKVDNSASAIEFCQDLVKQAHSIKDNGQILDCAMGGHYIFVKDDKYTLVLNSSTYELIDVKVDK